MFSKRTSLASQIDYPLFFAIVALLLFGVLMVFDASVIYSFSNFGGKYYFLILQAVWVLLGIVILAIFFKLDFELVKKFTFFLFIFSLSLLLFTILPTPFSPEIYGARRWLYLNPEPLPVLPFIGRVGFQPTELFKLALIVYFSFWLKVRTSFREYLYFLALLFVSGLLILLEPDFATTLTVLGIAVGVYFVKSANLKYLFLTLPILLALGLGLILVSPYRRQRLMTFLNPSESDPLSSGYHSRQILIALGSGGLFGLGPGESRQKYNYLPEVTSDSIFAVFCEEFGFVGGLVLVSLFFLVLYRIFIVARNAKDPSLVALVSGVGFWFGLQTLLNLSSMVGLTPLTGVPLPLVSYGGSSTIFLMAALGLVLRVSALSRS